jgi:hypothetical protein
MDKMIEVIMTNTKVLKILLGFGSILSPMSCVFMTASAVKCFYGMFRSLKDFLVATNTLIFNYFFIEIFYPNRIKIIPGGKGIGMQKTIDSFGAPFSKEILRGVAIITRSRLVMGCLYPTLVVIIHNMAIDTGIRIIEKIGISFGVVKSEGPYTNWYAN